MTEPMNKIIIRIWKVGTHRRPMWDWTVDACGITWSSAITYFDKGVALRDAKRSLARIQECKEVEIKEGGAATPQATPPHATESI